MKLNNCVPRSRHDILIAAHYWNAYDYYEEGFRYDTQLWEMRLFWPTAELSACRAFYDWVNPGQKPGLVTKQRVNGVNITCYCVDIQAGY